ncbi:MAG: 50S ribosomal protein L10 [Planctomycetota bacterium]|nr:MAG: 50S ribosomal protein L10 [Planctomycetota bacterium]REJ97188.1 MAG: 50S ribosomal protein L10 [Planctomycetota bacterium]REK27997.1 MAG: 50S ribosomal protein L10 [Planctomycetota bacterium]REK48686.1 MAG: 50S ribosomal protein L10 [Planctomycetota bacterium]
MSKFVKNLVSEHFRGRFDGVESALLVNVIGLDANCSAALRKELRDKGFELMVIKNSLARRATEGTPLEAAFTEAKGTLAVMWGGEDIVSLAKEFVRISRLPEYEGFEARGGVMEGNALSADEVKAVSKWPSREEQLSILMGQLLGPGAQLSGALLGPGALLASQIEKKADGAEGEEAAA